MAEIELRDEAGRVPQAGNYLREVLILAGRTGDAFRLAQCLDLCGHLCAAQGRWNEAVTLWAAFKAHLSADGRIDVPQRERDREGPLRSAAAMLGPDGLRAAEERGVAMSPETVAEFAIMCSETIAPIPKTAETPPSLPELSARERELVTLVAQGQTDAQIAGQLFISVSTVRSHLDRIRDKTSCRRRADLTRLALRAGLA